MAARERPRAAAPDPKTVLLICSGATFMSFLDVTVVNLAFPDLHRTWPTASVAGLSWVITGYTVLLSALLTPFGRLAESFGRRRLFLVGTAVFTVASAASAFAPDLGLLVAARAVQGAAAAAMIPSSLGLVLACTPLERMSAAVGLWGSAAAASAAVGPTVGGALVDAFGWRSVFIINLPLGAAIWLAGRRVLTEVRSGGRAPDALGTVMLASGIGLLTLGVSEGPTWHWGSAATIGCLVGSAVLLFLALRLSISHPAPAVETSLWRIRGFAAANATSLLFGAAVYAWLLECVLFMTGVWHYDELTAGLAMTPGAFTAAVASIATGRIADRRGHRLPVVIGALILAGDALWISLALTPEPRFLALWLPGGLIGGIGMGAVFSGVSAAAATSVPPERFAAGTGLNLTARQLGGALGIAALAAIMQPRLGDGISAYVDVFAFCGIAAAASSLAALRLGYRRSR